jgi:hypothetical protein
MTQGTALMPPTITIKDTVSPNLVGIILTPAAWRPQAVINPCTISLSEVQQNHPVGEVRMKAVKGDEH